MRTFLGLLAAGASLWAQAPAFYQSDFPPEEFRARWNTVYDKIGNQAVAVMQGVPLTAGSCASRI